MSRVELLKRMRSIVLMDYGMSEREFRSLLKENESEEDWIIAKKELIKEIQRAEDLGLWFFNPTFTRRFDTSARFAMVKKEKKLTRKEKKAAKEGGNTSKNQPKKGENSSRNPTNTSRGTEDAKLPQPGDPASGNPAESSDEGEDAKRVRPDVIADEARQFINEIALSEKKLNDEYEINAKIQGDQDISEGARQITTEQTEQLKKLFKSAKKAVEEVGIMKEPLELAIPLLLDPELNTTFTQQHLATFRICIDTARKMSSWELEEAETRLVKVQKLATKIYNCTTEAMQAFTTSCEKNFLPKMIYEGHPIGYDIGLMKTFNRVWDLIECMPPDSKDSEVSSLFDDVIWDVDEEALRARRNAASNFMIQEISVRKEADKVVADTMEYLKSQGVTYDY
ncbi:hypothetical protein BZA77DRAFT_357826 [Pyronema omphalodes]|nr:hypothetical protein BZA77DRAFT_357826 [Pyronema omphalodes]